MNEETAALSSVPADAVGRPMAEAPRDGTIIRLLIDWTGSEDWSPLTDDMRSWTIGGNSLDHTEEDFWQYVGWNWSQDCFIDLRTDEGAPMPIGWLPFAATHLPAPEGREAEKGEAERRLAQHVMQMTFLTGAGHLAKKLAMEVLGIPDPFRRTADEVCIVTNGTTRFLPRDEPVFLLRGQDVAAADAVRAWADLAGALGAGTDILKLAREQADRMDAWHPKKTPDLCKGDPNDLAPTPASAEPAASVPGEVERLSYDARARKRAYQEHTALGELIRLLDEEPSIGDAEMAEALEIARCAWDHSLAVSPATPTPASAEPAASVPGEVERLLAAVSKLPQFIADSSSNNGEPMVKLRAVKKAIRDALASASVPMDKTEEAIRLDERDKLYAYARRTNWSELRTFLSAHGAMHPTDRQALRASPRQGER